jgi:hypothetical protein
MSQSQRDHGFHQSHFNLLHVSLTIQSGSLFYADLYLLACAIEHMKWSCKLTYLVLANTSYTDSNLPPSQLSSQKAFMRARWRNLGDTRCRRIHDTWATRADISGDCFAHDMHWHYSKSSYLQPGSKFTLQTISLWLQGIHESSRPWSFLMFLALAAASFVPLFGLTWTMQNSEKKPWGRSGKWGCICDVKAHST